jgi:hypothetical protein
MMNAPKPAFDHAQPDVVNGGFRISFDRDHTGPLITITCPQGHIFNLWEKGTDTDRPVIYGWENKDDEEAGSEPAWQIVTPRRGRLVTRVEVGTTMLLLIERSYDDQSAADGELFYTIHAIEASDGDWATRKAEEDDQTDNRRIESYAEACIELSLMMVRIGSTPE